jgi:hypothetical protein
MKKLFLMVVFFIISIFFLYPVSAFAYNANIDSKLTVEISEDRQNLIVLYEIKNNSNSLLPPDQSDTYAYEIRNVATGKQILGGNLESAYQTNISQYASPYAHAIFAVKKIPIPDEMKQNPGFYLMFLFGGRNINAEETVFYIPKNIDNPNPVIQQIRALLKTIVNLLKRKLRVYK